MENQIIEETSDGVLQLIENIFDKMGMMYSPMAPVYRFLLTGALSLSIIFILQPRIFFKENGYPKQWALTNLMNEHVIEDEEFTLIPFWFIPLIVGTFFSTKI